MTPKRAAELVSRSFDRGLDAQEKVELQDHLRQNEDSVGFAATAKTIHRVAADVSHGADQGEGWVAPALTTEARIR